MIKTSVCCCTVHDDALIVDDLLILWAWKEKWQWNLSPKISQEWSQLFNHFFACESSKLFFQTSSLFPGTHYSNRTNRQQVKSGVSFLEVLHQGSTQKIFGTDMRITKSNQPFAFTHWQNISKKNSKALLSSLLNSQYIGCCHFHQVTVLTESSDHFLETSIETPEVCGMEVLSQGPQWISLYLNDKGMQKWCPPNSLIEKSYLPRLKLTGTYLGTTNLLGNSHLVRFCLHAFSGCKAWVQLPFFGPI